MESVVRAGGSSATSSPPPPSSRQPKTSKQACDNCRRRKIKCNRAQPCDKCQRLLLSCSYCDVLQRKGPKFRTLYPLAPLQTLVSQFPTPPQSVADQTSQSELMVSLEGWPGPVSWNINVQQAYEPYSSPESVDSHLVDSQYELPNAGSSYQHGGMPPHTQSHSPLQQQMSHPQTQSQSYTGFGRLSPMVILAHMNIYLKYLYPIIPIINPEQLLNDSQSPEQLSSQRYAFISALCAATHVQLQLDAMIDPAASSSSSYHDSALALSDSEILSEATRARNDCNNICEEVNLESLLTSFFLFAAHGNLDQHDQAWFYLSQATSLALTLELHREATYAAFEEEKAEERRRIFWLLFVTERAYALQQAKPVMLRNSIRKPAILQTEDHIVQYGFHNLIEIFEKLTPDLYDWITVELDENLIASMTAARTNLRDRNFQNCFSRPVPLRSVAEIQKLDAAAKQKWLQVMAWKLSMSDLSQFRSADALLPFHFPVLVAKAAMDVFQGSTVLQSLHANQRRLSVANHDPGMQDYIGEQQYSPSIATLSESYSSPNSRNINNEEFILDILNVLCRIRSNQSPTQNHQSQRGFLFSASSASTTPANQLFAR